MTIFSTDSGGRLRLASTLALSLMLASPTQASVLTLRDNGPSSNRLDMVYLGDGYTATQQGLYHNQVASNLAYLFDTQDPLTRYRNFFNVHRIDLVSNQSGADVPNAGISRDTALGASYGQGSMDRLLTVSYSAVSQALNTHLPGVTDLKMVVVNDSRYGGSGGPINVFAAGHRDGNEVSIHELGHTLGKLADEYGGYGAYNSSWEPYQANLTLDPSGQKWEPWLGYQQPGIGTIGVYAGGYGYNSGIYRPSNNSKMRSLYQPFDAVSREQMVLQIYRFVDPLDNWLDNSAILQDPARLWVDVVDPAVIAVQWYLDGVLLEGYDGTWFDPSIYDVSPGQHQITARAYDPTDWVRQGREQLQQSVTWTIEWTGPTHRPVDSVPVPASGLLLGLGLLVLRLDGRLLQSGAIQSGRVRETNAIWMNPMDL